MRLLDVTTLTFTEFFISEVPRYAIASHRWVAGTEVTLSDVRQGKERYSPGYLKVEGFARYVRTQIPGLRWLWIDTCCIKQDSDRELSEAINSMFRWYQNADVCLAYLQDVPTARDTVGDFEKSTWFSRGWTLQELLAPTVVVFLARDWDVIGHKGKSGQTRSGLAIQTGPSLNQHVAAITQIPENILQDYRESSHLNNEDKLKWTHNREATREEDLSYCLLGLLGVNMNIRYGEGGEKTRRRLLKKVHSSDRDNSLRPEEMFKKEDDLRKGHQACSTVPFARDNNFVGRQEILDRIESEFSGQNHHSRLALTGLGGIGKSQIAIEYSYRYRERNAQDWVFWVHASTKDRFAQSYRQIANIVEIPGLEDPKANVLQLVHDWLSQIRNGRWLMIVDNLDDPNVLFPRHEMDHADNDSEAPLSLYIPQSHHGVILMTSRNHTGAVLAGGSEREIPIGQFDKKTAMALLSKKLVLHGKDEYEDAKKLLDLLDYIPLAMGLAIAYMQKTRMPISKYLSIFGESETIQARLLSKQWVDIRRDPRVPAAIITSWKLSLDQIQQMSRNAVDILSLLSMLDRQGIPESLLSCETMTELDAQEGIGLLLEFSLVAQEEDGTTYTMHRLVQVFTRAWLELNQKLEFWEGEAVRLVANRFPNPSFDNWAECALLLPHARRTIEYETTSRLAVVQAELLGKIGRYSESQGNYHDAEMKYRRALSILEQQLGHKHPNTLATVENLANAVSDQGRYKAAEMLYRQILKVDEQQIGLKHLNTLRRRNYLADILLRQGHHDEAKNLYTEVMLEREQQLGSEHIDTLRAVHGLAIVATYQGQQGESEMLYKRVRAGMEQQLGPEHPETLRVRHNLAYVYSAQGRDSDAEALLLLVLSVREQKLGMQHPYTLLTVEGLADIARDQKQYPKAQALYERALEGCRQRLGWNHPHTQGVEQKLASLVRYISEQGV